MNLLKETKVKLKEEKMNLEELLNIIDFSYYIEDNKIRLIDLQKANLGNIEDEEWDVSTKGIESLIDRLEIYWQDYIIRDIFELLKDFDTSKVKDINFDDNYLSLINVLEKLDKDKFNFHIQILKIISNPGIINID